MTFFQVASNIQISEGQSAHFEARLTPTEDPNMKVRDPEDVNKVTKVTENSPDKSGGSVKTKY
jgi:hypothetical protein